MTIIRIFKKSGSHLSCEIIQIMKFQEWLAQKQLYINNQTQQRQIIFILNFMNDAKVSRQKKIVLLKKR